MFTLLEWIGKVFCYFIGFVIALPIYIIAFPFIVIVEILKACFGGKK